MTAINTASHLGLGHKSAQPTSLGHRLQGTLTSGLGRKFPAASPPSGGATSPPFLMNRRLSFPILALLAVLALSLLFLMPGGPAQAQQAEMGVDTIPFDENDPDAVRTFTSEDPEEHEIEWSIRGLDAADFTINSSGVLEFENPPDYESPTDRMLDLNADGDGDDGDTGISLNGNAETTDPDDTSAMEYAGSDNMYQITVTATEMSGLLPQKRTDLHLTIDVPERGGGWHYNPERTATRGWHGRNSYAKRPGRDRSRCEHYSRWWRGQCDLQVVHIRGG